MAIEWVKSLQCRPRAAAEDVYTPNAKLLLPSASCRESVQGLKDVIIHRNNDHCKNRRHPLPAPPPPLPPPTAKRSQSTRGSVSDPLFPHLSELPPGHPSRNVVEIIFKTRWGPKPFPGRVEMVFKIRSMPRTVARFEEYRTTVRLRAESGKGRDGARCLADGNEMMRFRCVGPTSLLAGGGKGGAEVCTFAGSGAAHESGDGGRGKRGMLVCRVIAGRVLKRGRVGESDPGGWVRVGFDSVSREDDGVLLVFDARAVLPCFLVIYTL